VREQRNDPLLVVYSCPAGAWRASGYRPDTGRATASHPPTTVLRREPHRAYTHMASMFPTTLHKEFHMKMIVALGNPLLIAIYSARCCLLAPPWACTGRTRPQTHSGSPSPAACSWPCITQSQVFYGSC
jgi:hypothetical protein